MNKRLKRLRMLRLELAKWLLWKNFAFTKTPEYYWEECPTATRKLYLAYARLIMCMFDDIKLGFYSKKRSKFIRLRKVLKKLKKYNLDA